MAIDNFGAETNVNYSCITMVDNIVGNMCPVAQSTNLFSGPMWPVCKVWIEYKGVGEVGQALLLIANLLFIILLFSYQNGTKKVPHT